jgi:SPP1 family phage portal protein
MAINEIRMSIEDTKKLDGNICSQIMSQMLEEFIRQDYLLERYTRSRELKEMRNVTDPTKMDIICAYEKYITDVAVGYVIGKKPTYYNKEKETVAKKKTLFGVEKEVTFKKDVKNTDSQKENDEFLNILADIQDLNHDQKENIRLTRQAFITSKAYELIYTNEYGDIRYKMLRGHCALIKSDDIESSTIGFMRQYKSTKQRLDNGVWSYEEYTIIELYTHFKRVYYSSEDGYVKEHPLYKGNVKPFMDDWEIPIVAIEMPYGLGLFEQQVSEIRGYELVTNNTKKILNYNDDAILMISGVMFMNGESEDEINDVINRYKTQGVIFTGNSEDGGEAKWLTKQVNDGVNQSHKDNLKNDIYGVAGLFNPENDSAVYQNTLSLVFKLYGLETKMSEYEEIFKDAMRRRNKIIAQLLNATERKNYNWRNIDLTMFRNLPTNTNEELNFVNQAREILPLEKIYEELSFVTDPKQMIKDYEADQIRQAKLDAKVAEILAEATNKDMVSDNPNNKIDNQNDVKNNDDENEDEDENANNDTDDKNSNSKDKDNAKDTKDTKKVKNTSNLKVNNKNKNKKVDEDNG